MDKKRRRRESDEDNGFKQWGGYMAAKVAKLDEQFKSDAELTKISNIFSGVAIYINGNTKPSAEELKKLMAQHGGLHHMYQLSLTTHIIASNLPNVKIKNLGTTPVVKPDWIVESISLGKLLDFRRYLLYTYQSVTQPKLDFPVVEKPNLTNSVINNSSNITDVSYKKNNVSVDKEPTNNRIAKTASDPNFVQEFFENSRLHLISTLSAEYKQLVCHMRDKHDGIFIGRQNLIATKGKKTATVLPNKVIMHIDMDCFFVSVTLRKYPEHRGKPVAITHAKNGETHTDRSKSRSIEFNLMQEQGRHFVTEGSSSTSRIDNLDGFSSMSEIASASYEARKCGIKNGMFLGAAVKLCPELVTLPYDFEGYREVSNTLYRTIASYTLDIEAVSCDEMYVDCTQILKDTGLTVSEFASHIRGEIMSVTGCPCSTGFGANRLQARLATRKAKPAGQFYLQPDDVEAYFSKIPLGDLPGVGHATLAKLAALNIATCGDVQVSNLDVLKSELGAKSAEILYNQAKGVDMKPLNYYQERKQVSAEINYGIRFKTLDECYNFLQSLSNEVYKRLSETGMRARCLTLKLLVRAENAPVETAKFLGHGVCDILTKSSPYTIINNAETVFKQAKQLYDKLNPPFVDLRGVGIHLTKLEKVTGVNTMLAKFLAKKDDDKSEKDTSNIKKEERKSIETVNSLTRGEQKTPSPIPKQDQVKSVDKTKVKSGGNKLKSSKRGLVKSTTKPPLNNTLEKFFNKRKSSTQRPVKVDMDVLSELPEDIRNEIIKEYQLDTTTEESPNLNSKMSKKCTDTDAPTCLNMSVLNELPEDIRAEIITEYNLDKNLTQHKNEKPINKEVVPEAHKKKQHDSSEQSPFKNLSWNETKPVLKIWISSERSPEPCDVKMIADHLSEMVFSSKIETLFSAFNFIHRVLSQLDCHWHNAYYQMLEVSQKAMKDKFGCGLDLKTSFNCCKM